MDKGFQFYDKTISFIITTSNPCHYLLWVMYLVLFAQVSTGERNIIIKNIRNKSIILE